jgi:DNA-binding Xre family transcriptional regulator
MKKTDLQKAAGVSWASVTKLSKSETVSMDILIKICKTLECDIGDIMELIPDEETPKS